MMFLAVMFLGVMFLAVFWERHECWNVVMLET